MAPASAQSNRVLVAPVRLPLALASPAAIGVPARPVFARARTVWATTVNSVGWQNQRSLRAIRLVALVRKHVAFFARTTPVEILQLQTLTAMASASQRINLRAVTTGLVLPLAAASLAAIGVPVRLACARARTVWATTVNSAGCLKPVSRHAIHRVVLVCKREDLAVPITPTATQPLRTLTAMASVSRRTSLRAATTGRVLLLAVVSRAAIGAPARPACARARTVWATTVSSAGWQNQRSLLAIRRVVRVHKHVAFSAPTTPMETLQLRKAIAMASASQPISLRAATTGLVLPTAMVLLAAIGVPARLACVHA